MLINSISNEDCIIYFATIMFFSIFKYIALTFLHPSSNQRNFIDILNRIVILEKGQCDQSNWITHDKFFMYVFLKLYMKFHYVSPYSVNNNTDTTASPLIFTKSLTELKLCGDNMHEKRNSPLSAHSL